MSLRPKLVIFLALPFLSLSAAEKYFPKTAVGRTELKKIPAATLIASTSQRGYFVENNGLFRPLFRYISSNNIAMTTPVEAEISPGKMYFYIGRDAADRDLDSTDEVEVLNLPQRFVASIGARGAYSESNFREGKNGDCQDGLPQKLSEGTTVILFGSQEENPGAASVFQKFFGMTIEEVIDGIIDSRV